MVQPDHVDQGAQVGHLQLRRRSRGRGCPRSSFTLPAIDPHRGQPELLGRHVIVKEALGDVQEARGPAAR